MSKEPIKHDHHYVFRQYLSAWANHNMLWYNNNGHVSNKPKSTKSVAHAEDFYKVLPINETERYFILYMTPESEKQEMANHIAVHNSNIEMASKHRKQAELFGEICKARFGIIPPDIQESLNDIKHTADVAIYNLMENFYGEDEKRGIETWIIKLKSGNCDFYYDIDTQDKVQDKRDFLSFLATQYFRTKAVRERMIKSTIEAIESFPGEKEKLLDTGKVRPAHIQPLLIWLYQCNMADALYSMNCHLTLLKNNTSIKFITGDQPIINTKADYNDGSAEVRELLLYYPVSPEYAITLNDNNVENLINISDEEADYYNKKMAAARLEQLYASTKELAERY